MSGVSNFLTQQHNYYQQSVRHQIVGIVDKINWATYRMLTSPYGRVGLVVMLITICCVHTAHAKDLDTIIGDIYNKFYKTYRGPICGVGVGAAGLRYWSSNPNGKGQAVSILAGTAVFAMVPVILNFIATMTGTTDPTPQ